MITEIEIINDLFGKDSTTFTRNDLLFAMRTFSNQFKYIETTCGKRIDFDDLDYDLLRQKNIFWYEKRNCVMALWFTENKRVVAPIAKLMFDVEGKSVIRYKDANPLNLKRDNIEIISHQVAHYKSKKQKTSSGNTPTSKYKGVSWSGFAKKWCAYIKIDYKKKHLGYFTDEESAAREYNKAACENWGKEYAELNVISD